MCKKKNYLIYLKSIKINTKKLVSNQISIEDTYNNLGLIYEAQGKLDKAEELFLKSLKIKVNKLGSNHI